jgi:ribosomal protein S18 acetylase RimI-like enzyme
MKSIGFTQWNEDYPTREILERDIEYGCLFGAYSNEKLAGFAALNEHQSEEYEKILWKFGEPYLVVHRLQVDPSYRGKGIAYLIMLFADRLAKERGYKAIRLDTRQDNIPAIALYEKLGYQKRGHVHFPRMMEYEFPCFEKEIL